MHPDGNRVRVLVVDDSPFMRAAIKRILESDPDIEVIGTAGDGLEAIEKVKRLKPDLVTLDVQMPRMDGLTALRRIMSEHPLPVIMLSSMTEDGARVTLEAMEIGAVDYLPKNIRQSSLDIIKVRKELLERVKVIARSWRKKRYEPKGPTAGVKPKISPATRARHPIEIVVIGVSTGGPRALQRLLPKLPGDLPAGILIAQHMPPQFTKLLAERLDQMCRIRVVEGKNGEEVCDGKAIIAPGGRHMKVIALDGAHPRIRVIERVEGMIYVPSVDLLMESAAKVYGDKVLALILTGMGNDGLKGMKAIKERGGVTLAQDESSSVIFGMPKACIEAGLVDEVLPLNEIPHRLIEIIENGR